MYSTIQKVDFWWNRYQHTKGAEFKTISWSYILAIFVFTAKSAKSKHLPNISVLQYKLLGTETAKFEQTVKTSLSIQIKLQHSHKYLQLFCPQLFHTNQNCSYFVTENNSLQIILG